MYTTWFLRAGCLIVALAAGVPTLAADLSRGPTIIIEPGDVTPLRSPRIINPQGPSHVTRPIAPPRRIIPDPGYELDRLESRVHQRPTGEIARYRVRRDLDVAGQELRSLKTLRPQAGPIPLFERQLDRLQRPTRLGQ